MRKIILSYGFFMGVIVCAFMLISFFTMDVENADFDGGEILGFLSMVVSFILMFVGVKQVRDKHLGGSISLVMGLKTSGLMLLIASCMYSITWTVYVKGTDSKFYEKYYEHQLSTIEDPEELAEKQEDAEEVIAQMKNPILLFLYTTLEMIIPGLLFVLGAAFMFRRKATVK